MGDRAELRPMQTTVNIAHIICRYKKWNVYIAVTDRPVMQCPYT